MNIYIYGERNIEATSVRVLVDPLIHEQKKLNSVALFHKRTIPTERPAHVGEVSANFCG
jgi:hypothetical protein